MVNASIQSCFFTHYNEPLFDASKKRRVTQEDIAKALSIAPNTVDRCLKGIGHSNTIKAVNEVANRIGYQKTDKWRSIKKEFILKFNTNGQPQIDEKAICILRQRGNHARNIHRITGLSIPRIKRIFKKYGLSPKNLQRIEENGLSLRQRHEARMLQIELKRHNREKQFKIRGSDLRKNGLFLFKKYKSGIPIEQAARELSIERSLAYWLSLKIKSFKIIKERKKNYGYGERYRSFVDRRRLASKKYKNESQMISDVMQKIKHKYPNSQIMPEAKVIDAFSGNRIGNYRADFVIKVAGAKDIAVEVKHKTTSCSLKALFGQIFIYKSAGYQVECVLPDDTYCPEYAKKIFAINNVNTWTV